MKNISWKIFGKATEDVYVGLGYVLTILWSYLMYLLTILVYGGVILLGEIIVLAIGIVLLKLPSNYMPPDSFSSWGAFMGQLYLINVVAIIFFDIANSIRFSARKLRHKVLDKVQRMSSCRGRE